MPSAVGRRVGLADVATQSGVALSTASNALNNRGRVAEATRVRVQTVAHELGYLPNPAARGLRGGRSRLIGVALRVYMDAPDLYPSDIYYGLLIAACTTTASQRGYAVALLPDTQMVVASELPLAAMIVTDTSPIDPTLEIAYGLGVPVITDYRPNDSRATAMVDTDFIKSVALINEHLVASGARRIGLLSVTNRTTSFVNSWEQAHTRWCEVNDVPVIIEFGSSVDRETLDAAALRIVLSGCDGVVGIPIGSGLALINAAKSLGRRVPDDVLVAVIDEDPELAHPPLPITTVGLDPINTATQGTHLVIDVLEDKVATPVELLIPAVLNVRASTQR